MSNRKQHKAPKHLQPATQKWFLLVMADYSLESHHVLLLQLAAEAWDRCQQAREMLDGGLTVPTADGGLKAHPCVAIERDARLAFARLIRELDLDTEPPAHGRSSPPALASNRR